MQPVLDLSNLAIRFNLIFVCYLFVFSVVGRSYTSISLEKNHTDASMVCPVYTLVIQLNLYILGGDFFFFFLLMGKIHIC